jgi:hypothetical protein
VPQRRHRREVRVAKRAACSKLGSKLGTAPVLNKALLCLSQRRRERDVMFGKAFDFLLLRCT